MTIVLRRYSFKVYPTSVQRERLFELRRLHLDLFNALVWQRLDRLERQGEHMSFFTQSKELAKLRAEFPEYAAMCSGSMAETARRVQQAVDKFWADVKAWSRDSGRRRPRYPGERSVRVGKRQFRLVRADKGLDRFPGFAYREHGKGWKFVEAGPRTARLRFKDIPGTVKIRGKFPDDFDWGDAAPDGFSSREVVEHTSKTGGRRRAGSDDPVSSGDRRVWWTTMTAAPGSDDPVSSGDGKMVRTISLSWDGANWWGSIAVRIAPRITEPGEAATQVRIDGVDHLATVDNQVIAAPVCPEPQQRGRENRTRLRRKFARRRKHQMHVKTTEIVRRAGDVTVIKPEIKDATKSGRGDEVEWGGAVKTKAKLNRHLLDQAPAEFIQMLHYKTEAAGGTFVEVIAENAPAEIGNQIVNAAKSVREARRLARKGSRKKEREI